VCGRLRCNVCVAAARSSGSPPRFANLAVIVLEVWKRNRNRQFAGSLMVENRRVGKMNYDATKNGRTSNDHRTFWKSIESKSPSPSLSVPFLAAP
jgi:hypothetical protein